MFPLPTLHPGSGCQQTDSPRQADSHELPVATPVWLWWFLEFGAVRLWLPSDKDISPGW